MTESTFEAFRADDGGRLSYWEAGTGKTIVAILGEDGRPTRAHELLAEAWRVIVFTMPADAGMPREAARRIGAAVAALGVERFDLIGEGDGAAAALWLAITTQAEVGAVVLAAPTGPPEAGLDAMTRPALVLSGTRNQSDANERYRWLLSDCHFMLVYEAGSAIAAERPEAYAFIVREFLERGDLFLVSRESGLVLP